MIKIKINKNQQAVTGKQRPIHSKIHTFASMAFYKSILEHYDDIFPQNPMQLDFVRNSFENTKDLKLLDVGCGTGSLSIALAPYFEEVTGVDPDQAMLEKAFEKSAKYGEKPLFFPYGMLELEKNYPSQHFDSTLCFGNTLVHLATEDEIFDFLRQVRQMLRSGGKFLLQIINYDRIIDQEIDGLPTIENEKIKFVRRYHHNAGDRSIDFETELSIKETGEVIKNNITLFAVLKSEINNMLLALDFKEIIFYGNFKRDPFLPNSIPLIVEAIAP